MDFWTFFLHNRRIALFLTFHKKHYIRAGGPLYSGRAIVRGHLQYRAERLVPKPVVLPRAWCEIAEYRKPVIQGVLCVIGGNSYRVRKDLLVAGFVLEHTGSPPDLWYAKIR